MIKDFFGVKEGVHVVTKIQGAKIARLPGQGNQEENSILEEVYRLVRAYQLGSLSMETMTAKGKAVIENLSELSSEQHPLIRKACGYLLKIDIEELQIEVVKCLKATFQVNVQIFQDVVNNQLQEIAEVERFLSSVIDQSIRKTQSKTLLLKLLDLYEDVLEYLWLLPHLTDHPNFSDLSSPDKQHIIDVAQSWLILLPKDETFHVSIENINYALKKLSTPLPEATVKFIDQLILQADLSYPPDELRFALAVIYIGLGEYHRAIYHLEKCIWLSKMAVIATNSPMIAILGEESEEASHVERSKIIAGLGDRSRWCGDAYFRLRQFSKAIEYHQVALTSAQETENQEEAMTVNYKLGDDHKESNSFPEATQFYSAARTLAQKLDDKKVEMNTNLSLGKVYSERGMFLEAKDHYEMAITIAKALDDQTAINLASEGLVDINYLLRDGVRAFIHHQQALVDIKPKELGPAEAYLDPKNELDRALEASQKLYVETLNRRRTSPTASYSISQIIQDNEQVLKIMTDCINPLILRDPRRKHLLSDVYQKQALAYFMVGNYPKAQENYHHSLLISQELSDVGSQVKAYMGLGKCCVGLKQNQEAIPYLEKAETLAKNPLNNHALAEIYKELGWIYAQLELTDCLKIAEHYFDESIRCYSTIMEELRDNNQWKLTFTKRQIEAYKGLELVLIRTGTDESLKKALEIIDRSRSQVLSAILSKKIPGSGLSNAPMSVQEMQKLAEKLGTIIVVYSFTFCGIIIGLVLPTQELDPFVTVSLEVNDLPENLKKLKHILNKFPFIRTDERSLASVGIESLMLTKGGKLSASENRFAEALKKWYEAFIQPIEDFLKVKDEDGNPFPITIIPDGILSYLPFAAFQDREGKYLIEKCPVSIAPSIRALQLLANKPRPSFQQESCIVANPETPNEKEHRLTLSEQNARENLQRLFKTPEENIFTGKRATFQNILQKLSTARWGHFSCHGLPDTRSDPESVFEGELHLAGTDSNPKGHLFAQEIARSSLQSELIFLDACFSGVGKLHMEGSIGPVWSFLAAGASSVIGSYWYVPESELTNRMINTFYQQLLQEGISKKITKAEALRQAMLMGIKEKRDQPHLWAFFYLSGLS